MGCVGEESSKPSVVQHCSEASSAVGVCVGASLHAAGATRKARHTQTRHTIPHKGAGCSSPPVVTLLSCDRHWQSDCRLQSHTHLCWCELEVLTTPTVLDIIAIVATMSLQRNATADTAAIWPSRLSHPARGTTQHAAAQQEEANWAVS